MIFWQASKLFLRQHGATFSCAGGRKATISVAFGEKRAVLPLDSSSTSPIVVPCLWVSASVGVCACDGRGSPLCDFLSTPCIFAQTEPQVTSTKNHCGTARGEINLEAANKKKKKRERERSCGHILVCPLFHIP